MIGIVGAGISGLALNHYLADAGAETAVWEAAGEAGGVVRTRHADGQPLECGPQRLRLTPGIRELAAAAGVDDELRTAPDLPLYAYRDGDLRVMPLSPRTAVTTDLLSWRSKARILLEPLTGPVREDETVGAFLRRSFGTEAATHCFGPLYAGLYAADPDEMPVEHSLAEALERFGVGRSVLVAAARKLLAGREAPPMATVEGGLQRIPEGLVAAHDGVHLNAPVRTVERVGGDGGGDHQADGRYAVETPAGRTVVDDLVVTTPAGTAADLLEGVAPDAAGRLAQLSYNPLAVVHLRADWAFDGVGVKVPGVAGFATRGLTAHGPLFGRDGIVTAYLGGSDAPDLVDRDDDHLRSVAAREFREITGAEAEPLAVTRVRPGMPAYDHTWDALDGLELPDGLHLCTNYVARAGVPGRVRQAKGLARELTGDADGQRADRASPEA
jgi:oxygen-dependent protoporphyrinogen oxidase